MLMFVAFICICSGKTLKDGKKMQVTLTMLTVINQLAGNGNSESLFDAMSSVVIESLSQTGGSF